MAKTYNRLEIDVNKKPSNIGICPVQGDTKSRYLDVSLYENGVAIDLTGEQVRINFKKADGTTLFNQGEVTDAKKGRCQFALTNEILAEAKAVKAQISVWNAKGEILSTEMFDVLVSESIRDDEAVESENEFGVLVVLFQEIQNALDTMQHISDTFGEPGEKAAEYGVDTFWGILETLAGRGDVESSLQKGIKAYLNSTVGTSEFLSLDKQFVLNAILADGKSLNEWGFRQNKIGGIINVAFDLNSAALAACNTVAAIAASTAAINAIRGNIAALKACVKNDTILNQVLNVASDEEILAAGIGYLKYNIGDIVTLKYNGEDTQFRVVNKDYLTEGKIVLMSVRYVGSSVWNESGTSNYTTSNIREYLNSTVLSAFSSEIQSAIVKSPVLCHNQSVAVTCMDKIWTASVLEVGLGDPTYASGEGSRFAYFDSNDSRVTGNTWFLRTPYDSSNVYEVTYAGKNANTTVKTSWNVVPFFEI